MKHKRLVIASDLHCGSRVGLTPPGWQYNLRDASPQRREFAKLQRECWKFYASELKKLQPIDWLVCNGDAIDGRGSRNGGVELVTAELADQSNMATECLREAKAKRHLIIAGTPFHSSPDGEDWEGIIAERLDAKYGGHEWLEINGVVFDFKHKVGSSGTPYGRHTAVSKEQIWNLLWSERNWSPKSNVIVRSHVHYHKFSGDSTHLAMTTPALQAPGSTYGVRQCSGIVDFGFIHFDIFENGGYTWQAHLLGILSSRPKVVKG